MFNESKDKVVIFVKKEKLTQTNLMVFAYIWGMPNVLKYEKEEGRITKHLKETLFTNFINVRGLSTNSCVGRTLAPI